VTDAIKNTATQYEQIAYAHNAKKEATNNGFKF
jgi:hypothetical protein